jgi:hypothetical protein
MTLTMELFPEKGEGCITGLVQKRLRMDSLRCSVYQRAPVLKRDKDIGIFKID